MSTRGAAALSVREKAFGPEHRLVGSARYNLGVLYQFQNRLDEAEPHYRKAMEIQQNTLGAMHPLLADTLENYALLLMATGRMPDAMRLKRRADEIRARSN